MNSVQDTSLHPPEKTESPSGDFLHDVEPGSAAPEPAGEKPRYHGLRFTIALKVLLGTVPMLVILAVVGLVGIRSGMLVSERMAFISDKVWIAADAAMELRLAFLQKAIGMDLLLLGDLERAQKILQDSNSDFAQQLDRLRKTGLVEDTLLDEISREESEVTTALERLHEAATRHLASGSEGQRADVRDLAEVIFQALDHSTDQLVEIEATAAKDLAQSMEEAKQQVSSSTAWLIGCFVIGSLLCLATAGLTARLLSVPAKRISSRMNEIAGAAADLTAELDVSGTDEIAELASSFNAMRRTLTDIITEISRASLKISATSNEILSSATEHEATASEQSAQMTQIDATLKQTSASSTELSRTTREVVRFNKEVSRDAQEGAVLIQETDSRIQAMAESNRSVSAKLAMLGTKIQGIGKILTTILNVADQTNLLSFNAAIEAAKAGEHGKGFSVVAQEIRRLADRTAESSQEIATMVEEVQAASSSATMVMDKSGQDVAMAISSVNALAERFSAIGEKVGMGLEQVQEISNGVDEIAEGNRQISISTDEMSKAVQLTVAAAGQLKQSAYDLAAMGQQLRSRISRFKLK